MELKEYVIGQQLYGYTGGTRRPCVWGHFKCRGQFLSRIVSFLFVAREAALAGRDTVLVAERGTAESLRRLRLFAFERLAVGDATAADLHYSLPDRPVGSTKAGRAVH